MTETLEIMPLTAENIARLLAARAPKLPAPTRIHTRRLSPRWPFPGTVELWLTTPDRGERYELATSVNLSESGMGVHFEERLEPGTEVGIAIHEPEASFHGRAVVRHCAEIQDGTHLIGLQFKFDR